MPTRSHTTTTSTSKPRVGPVRVLQRALMGFVRRHDDPRDDVSTDPRDLVRARLDKFLDGVTNSAVNVELRLPDLGEHELAHFALTDLLPNRVLAASMFPAKVSASDVDHLRQFLDGIERGVFGQVELACDAETVADVLVQATEDLHSYLLGHDLVDQRYRHLTAGSLFRRLENSPAMVSRESWETCLAAGQSLGVAAGQTAADSHEYALAA